MTPSKEAMAKKITNKVWLTLDQAESLAKEIALALDSSDQSGYRRGVEEAANLADCHALDEMEGRATYTMKRIEDVAKSIRNLKETP